MRLFLFTRAKSSSRTATETRKPYRERRFLELRESQFPTPFPRNAARREGTLFLRYTSSPRKSLASRMDIKIITPRTFYKRRRAGGDEHEEPHPEDLLRYRHPGDFHGRAMKLSVVR